MRNHPELTDAQITKLVGTTKSTIQSIRDRSHWNSANIKPVDPVSLGLCSQIELDDAVKKAADRKAAEDAKAGIAGEPLEAGRADAPPGRGDRCRAQAGRARQGKEKELTAESRVLARLNQPGGE